MGVRIRDNNKIPEALERIREINAHHVSTGYFGPAFIGKKITNTGKALIQEYGANITVTEKMRNYFLARWDIPLKVGEVLHIPERSFIRTGAKKAEPIVMAKARDFIIAAILGETSAEEMYEKFGEEIKEAIQETAVYWTSPPNSSMTVHIKGFDDPLIASGEMIDAIEVKVR